MFINQLNLPQAIIAGWKKIQSFFTQPSETACGVTRKVRYNRTSVLTQQKNTNTLMQFNGKQYETSRK